MSRIGNFPIPITSGVTFEVKGRSVHVKGDKGEFDWAIPDDIDVAVDEGSVKVSRSANHKQARAMHGTTRALLANMIEGCANGYKKELELHGVGFRASVKGSTITLALGYSHPIAYTPPEGVTIVVEKDTDISITGHDKQKVSQAAAQIRSYYPAEPYKGKGVRYKGEVVRRKAGKAIS